MQIWGEGWVKLKSTSIALVTSSFVKMSARVKGGIKYLGYLSIHTLKIDPWNKTLSNKG